MKIERIFNINTSETLDEISKVLIELQLNEFLKKAAVSFISSTSINEEDVA